MQTILALFLMAVGTWRLSYMLVNEDGPYFILLNYRSWPQNHREKNITWATLADLVTCIYCTSIWVGAALALFYAPNLWAWILYTLLNSTFAIFLDKVHDRLAPKDG